MEFEALHVSVLILTAVGILYADKEVAQYIRGTKELLDEKLMRWLHRGVWVGLILMIATGVGLYLEKGEPFLGDPAFLIKMFMVGALVANGFVIGQLTQHTIHTPFRNLSKKTTRAFFVSGGISAACWIGATLIGLFFL